MVVSKPSPPGNVRVRAVPSTVPVKAACTGFTVVDPTVARAASSKVPVNVLSCRVTCTMVAETASPPTQTCAVPRWEPAKGAAEHAGTASPTSKVAVATRMNNMDLGVAPTRRT